MHLLTARVRDNNAVVISHKTLARLLGVKSVTTIKTALAVLGRKLREQVSELEDERDEWRDEAHERRERHIRTIQRALDFAETHGIAPEDMAEYLKHGRDPHEKVYEHEREKDLDLDLD